MIPRSIRWRLLVAGAVAISAALALAALGISLLFARHAERVAVAELEDRTLALAALIETDAEGGARLAGDLPDPVYRRPLSGDYWQIDLGDEVRRSRSLWDATLDLPPAAPPADGTRTLARPGPLGADLLILDRSLRVGSGPESPSVRIAVAMDRSRLAAARREFIGDIVPFTLVLGLFLMAASAAQIAIGLRPFAMIGARVAALRRGEAERIGADLPVEIAPLAARIDDLLAARETELLRAEARAGDLAHGLKTPLQALAGEADRLRDSGQPETAAHIEMIAAAMRRHVDRELIRTRIRSGQSQRHADPRDVAERVIRVLRRTPDGAPLDWRIEGPADLRAAIDPGDLTEALGALLENAARHARHRVAVSLSREDARIAVEIADDGPGVPPDRLSLLPRRGLRLDRSADGHGIGLAIVADIAEAAGADLSLANGGPGLRVRLSLAAAP